MTAGAATSGGGDDAGVVVMSLRRCPWRAGIRVGSDALASYAADGEAGCVVDEELSRAVVAYPPGSGLTFPGRVASLQRRPWAPKLPRRCFRNCRSSYPVMQGAVT